ERVTDFESEPSLAARVRGWRATMDIVADYPVIGSGLGTFADAWLRAYPPGTGKVWKEAHNDYLQVAAETGLAGTTLLAWGLIVFVARHLLAGSARPPHRPSERALHHGMAIGVLSILFHSTVDFSLQVGAIALLFVVLSAVLAGESRPVEG